MVALTGIEPANRQLDSVQLSLSRYVFSPVHFATRAFRALRVAGVVCRWSVGRLGGGTAPGPLAHAGLSANHSLGSVRFSARAKWTAHRQYIRLTDKQLRINGLMVCRGEETFMPAYRPIGRTTEVAV